MGLFTFGSSIKLCGTNNIHFKMNAFMSIRDLYNDYFLCSFVFYVNTVRVRVIVKLKFEGKKKGKEVNTSLSATAAAMTEELDASSHLITALSHG
jgi:hypothetical protein